MTSQIEQSGGDTALTASKRILVAEDSPVTQDLLKLILSQRGHAVDAAEDGELALSALERGAYDAALIDFRLPKLDGLEVARRYRSKAGEDNRARLIAITADVEGLLSHKENCENFDEILAKPLDIYSVCDLIEQQGSADGTPPAAGEPRPDHGPAHATAGAPLVPEPSWTLGFEFLRWPQDFAADRISPGQLQSFKNLDTVDAILVLQPAAPADLAAIWQHSPLHLLPIIDLAGGLGGGADYSAGKQGADDAAAVRDLIQSFHRRRARLHSDFINDADMGEKLMSRLFVMDSPLETLYSPDARALVRYNVALNVPDAIREAEAQCKDGLMERSFFDRFQVCPQCFSSRLHVREECPVCRSSQLTEEMYIHHFRCGHQDVESRFRQGDKLVCPKCRKDLDHFSVDYDKPGAAIICQSCGNSGSEPAVGFKCLDCLSHFSSEQASTTDVFSYRLSAEGTAFMEMGYAYRGIDRRRLRFTDLPLEFAVALNAAAKDFNDNAAPFSVANLFYENEREIIREAGVRQFSHARDLFLENLKNAIGDGGHVVKGHSYDFCLLHGAGPDAAEAQLSDLSQRASSPLNIDLGLLVRVFGPADFV